ncbi:MAG TPA: prolyl oligopeptidase family serine peptidase [Steroidobacteraceae bacterium]|nr:prolyl oligopeptidase family serine peptidase [Steroidobacteraceae bacterium]
MTTLTSPTLKALMALTALLAAGAAHPAALEDYGRLPSLEDAAISPDGSRLAYVRTDGDERIVAVVSLPDRRPQGALKVGAERLRSIEWADNNRLLIRTSMVYAPVITTKMEGLERGQATPSAAALGGGNGGRGAAPTSSAGMGSAILSIGHDVSIRRDWSLLQVYDLNTHTTKSLPDPAGIQKIKLMNVIAGDPMVRQIGGHTVIFVPGLYYTDPGMGALYDETIVLRPALLRLDLDSGSEAVLRQGSKDTQLWLTDASGEVVAEQDYSEEKFGKQQRWALKILRNGRFDEAASGRESLDYPRLLGFGPTPDTLLVQAVDGEDSVWKLLSLKDGTFGPPIAARLSGPIEQRATYRLIGGAHIEDDSHYVFFDPATQGKWDALVRGFEGAHMRLVSLSDDFKYVVVRVEAPALGYKYELVDFNTHKADSIGNVYQGVTQPLPVHRVTYAAADGLQIPAYLTLPRNRAAKNMPLVVLPHSVATAVDTEDFDWWSQALADQGYAVLRPNFRGSQLSRKFMEAGFGEWGRKMQTDLSDGVRYLVHEGIVDPKRVCIVGAGYGGYAALAAVTLDPGVYRCAVSVDGLSDLRRWQKSLADQDARRSNPEQRGWQRFMEVAGANDAANLGSLSPIKHIDAVQVPVLLLHGRDDFAVPFEQSQMMYDALRHAGKQAELVALDHEDELFASGETRLAMLRKSVDFLRAYNPAD